MNDVELSSRLQTTLTTLINQYESTESPVGTKSLTDRLDRTPSTIRTNMRTLKTMGLAESVPGPNGGYEPTENGYEKLDRQPLEDASSVTLASNYERIEATVDRIEFRNVHHPELCRATVRFQQSVRRHEIGDAVLLGPTPVSSLVLGGEIVTVSESDNTVLLDVIELQAPFQDSEQSSA